MISNNEELEIQYEKHKEYFAMHGGLGKKAENFGYKYIPRYKEF